MKKILFVIPTLFTDPKLTKSCVSSLVDNVKLFDIEYKVCVVINEPSDFFMRYEFVHPFEKMCGNLQFNISRALNTAWKKYSDYDFFCFFDEGIRITNKNWIKHVLAMFEKNPNMGLLGCRPHTSFNYYQEKISDSPEIYEVLWSDGILITKIKTIQDFGGFDESYLAECELQDFGYRLHTSGFVNCYWKGLADSHKLIKFEKKHSDKSKLMLLRSGSRIKFYKKWSTFERNFGFQTISDL